ncbi:MAG: ATP-binding protein [Planctomycetales bacterium]|nr:ATP-binding protein [Planctomycetales bacterium]
MTEIDHSNWSRTIPFKVDVAGIIHLMGAALYSRPEAAVRELIQNAHDAIIRHRQVDLQYTGRIDVVQQRELGVLEFHDDGIGLSAEEAEQYLGTLGIGITGLLKGEHPSSASSLRQSMGMIGQFGIGLFSAFMIADEVTVTSCRRDDSQGIRWRAGPNTEILLSSDDRKSPGTTVSLKLSDMHRDWLLDADKLENVIRSYADYLTIPIYLNRGTSRINVIQSQWFDPTPDEEQLELEIASHFEETPLDVIPIHCSTPHPISGSLYVSPQRTPGFSDLSVVTVTVQRMVISSRVQDLIPPWASFVRGVLELSACRPTTSREELVRDATFRSVSQVIENKLFERLEYLADFDRSRFDSILNWHRYMLAGAAITIERLRTLLSKTYRFQTSHGELSCKEILAASGTNPIFESEFERVVWYNSDRRQESVVNQFFSSGIIPCVHTTRSFEESLLAAMIADETSECATDLRYANLASPGFARDILQIGETKPASEKWQAFLESANAAILLAEFRDDQPVVAFLNEKHELVKTFDQLKRNGSVPAAFQRLIDRHFDSCQHLRNEVLLNTNHRLVARALEQPTSSPLASVLRLLVLNALNGLGAASARQAAHTLASDLDWIADALWGKS